MPSERLKLLSWIFTFASQPSEYQVVVLLSILTISPFFHKITHLVTQQVTQWVRDKTR